MKVNPNVPSASAAGPKAMRAPVDGTKSFDNGGPSAAPRKETVGDIANRVATKGNVAPNQGHAVSGKGNAQLDKDAFFKLMLTHIKNQDPTSPLKSHEMAAQLAQFSSLEQMSNIKDILGEMNKGQSSSGQYQALNLIGKIVAGDSGKIERAAGEKLHPISFTLNEPAQELKISIKDAEGKVIKSMELQNQPKGNVKIDWDGKNIEGREQVPGTYKVSVEAKSVSGSKVPVDMQFKGAVTGIQFTEKGPIVFVGNKQVPLKEIKQIEVDDKAEVAGLPGAMPQQAQQAQQALGQMAPSQQGKKFISADQLSPDQQKGLEQALAALKGQGFSPAAAAQNPLTDPTQEVLASAIHNQEMKNQKL